MGVQAPEPFCLDRGTVTANRTQPTTSRPANKKWWEPISHPHKSDGRANTRKNMLRPLSLNDSLRLCHRRIQWYRTSGGFRPLARESATSKQIAKGKNQGVDLPGANHHASCIMISQRPSKYRSSGCFFESKKILVPRSTNAACAIKGSRIHEVMSHGPKHPARVDQNPQSSFSRQGSCRTGN